MKKINYFEHIPCTVTKEDVLRKMGMPVDHMYGKYIDEMIEASKDIVNPKAVLIEMKIEGRTADSVSIGGETFVSKTLANELANVDTVYAYLCTCGKEISDFSDAQNDMVKELALDGIMSIYLRKASIHMTELLDNELDGETSCVSPGSFEDWPLSEQHPFFALMGEYVDKTGVKLSESGVMFPVKSVSGFRYKTEKEEHNCKLCLKRECTDRKDAFDENLYESTLC